MGAFHLEERRAGIKKGATGSQGGDGKRVADGRAGQTSDKRLPVKDLRSACSGVLETYCQISLVS